MRSVLDQLWDVLLRRSHLRQVVIEQNVGDLLSEVGGSAVVTLEVVEETRFARASGVSTDRPSRAHDHRAMISRAVYRSVGRVEGAGGGRSYSKLSKTLRLYFWDMRVWGWQSQGDLAR